jgi:hypothetical protein
MLALSDECMGLILQLAKPLARTDRGRFLRDVAARLRGEAEVGPGSIARVAREIQRRYLHGTSAAVTEGLKLFEQEPRRGKRGGR